MQNTDPLSQLRDIHLPEPISFWPPAPGWWLLALLAIALLVAASFYSYQHYRKNRHRRLAIGSVANLYQQLKADNNKSSYLRSINMLLKQVSVKYYSKKEVADLSGKDWLAFLDRTGNTQDFTTGPGAVLSTGPYAKSPDFDPADLQQCCERWIRRHR